MNVMLKEDLDYIEKEFHEIMKNVPPRGFINPDYILGYLVKNRVETNYDAEKALDFINNFAKPTYFDDETMQCLKNLVEIIILNETINELRHKLYKPYKTKNI